WRHFLHWRSCQNFADKVGETKRHRQAVREPGTIEIELRQGHKIGQNWLDLTLAPDDLHRDRIGYLPSRIGIEAWGKADCPKVRTSRTSHDGCAPKNCILAVSKQLYLRLPPHPNAGQFRALRNHG